MKKINTDIPEVKIIKPIIFEDERGYFFESFNENIFQGKVKNIKFIQDNESKSTFGVLRGLHYQLPPYAQSKLVRVIKGKVLDVAVDIRKGSPTFRKFVTVELSEDNKKQLFIPRGFAHGYVVLSEEAIFAYKVDNKYATDCERGIIFNDNDLKIDWNIDPDSIILSEKDKKNKSFNEAELFKYNEKLY